jgi:hypothetical protein
VPFNRIPDRRLYTDREYCLAARFDLPAPPAPRPPAAGSLILHCYLSGAFTRHHALSIRSALATQRPPFAVWLWLDEGEHMRGFSAELLEALEYSDRLGPGAALLVKRLDWQELAADTPAETIPLPANPVWRSNHFRHLVQAKHGGIYFDLDMVVLRDLRGLLGAGVVSEWCGHPWANSALCSFSPRDSRRLLEEARRRWDAGECRRRTSTGAPDAFHPRELFDFSKTLPVDVLVLPVWLFDPLWPDVERGRARFEAFFDRPAGELPGFSSWPPTRPPELADWWPGAYAYHWHNGWKLPISPGSTADVLWRALVRANPGPPGLEG